MDPARSGSYLDIMWPSKLKLHVELSSKIPLSSINRKVTVRNRIRNKRIGRSPDPWGGTDNISNILRINPYLTTCFLQWNNGQVGSKTGSGRRSEDSDPKEIFNDPQH
jgi:hypothetical protein